MPGLASRGIETPTFWPLPYFTQILPMKIHHPTFERDHLGEYGIILGILKAHLQILPIFSASVAGNSPDLRRAPAMFDHRC